MSSHEKSGELSVPKNSEEQKIETKSKDLQFATKYPELASAWGSMAERDLNLLATSIRRTQVLNPQIFNPPTSTDVCNCLQKAELVLNLLDYFQESAEEYNGELATMRSEMEDIQGNLDDLMEHFNFISEIKRLYKRLKDLMLDIRSLESGQRAYLAKANLVTNYAIRAGFIEPPQLNNDLKDMMGL